MSTAPQTAGAAPSRLPGPWLRGLARNLVALTLIALALGLASGTLGAPPAIAAAAFPAPAAPPRAQGALAALSPFLGSWRLEAPPSQQDGRTFDAQYYRLELDLLGHRIRLDEFRHEAGASGLEHYVGGGFGWSSLSQQVEFQEQTNWGNFNRGTVEALDEHSVRRHMVVSYQPGGAMRWRETWAAGADGRAFTMTIEVYDGGGWKPWKEPVHLVRVERLPP